MKKLLICKLGTVFFGLLAVSVFSRFESVLLPLCHGDLLGACLALTSAIFGSQWIEYRKRMDKASPSLPGQNPIGSQAAESCC